MPVRSRSFGAALLAVFVALLAAPFVPRVLRACGPYFPLDILSSREQAALAPPPAISVTDGLAPTPGEKLPIDESDNEEARTRAELEGMSPEDADRVKAMRARSDGDAAYAAGEGLSAVVRDYTAGAVSYHHGQWDKARQYFTRVVSNEPSKAAGERRVVWAHFMLGAIARLQGDVDEAAAQWTVTRGLVRSGLPDPLGLAVASFGEEARLLLKPGTLAKAVSLYAKQASYGSERGRASLLMVAEQAIADPVLLDEGLGDETTRRLILRYLYAEERVGDEDEADGAAEPPAADAKAASDAKSPGDAKLASDAAPSAIFDRVFTAFERHRVSRAEGADLLAAQAYAVGRFDLAAKLAAYDSTALSSWITGKLALRRGDRQTALRAFADAVKGLPAHRSDRSRALAETGVLRLSGGDFTQAMEVFYGAVLDSSDSLGFLGTDYWADLAYLAERVLTPDELLPLVDRLAPAASRAEVSEAKAREAESPAMRLRALTGRRLMRAGRYDEALRYFEADEELHGIATKYIEALRTAGSWWGSKGTRAEAWFTAATIARDNGMELLGFELEPDYAIYEGLFSGVPALPIGAATPDERKRVDATKPAIDSRFHYRLTAVDHALASADFVPRTSQAFAAVLCRATSWIIDLEPERAAAIYTRYVKEGPYVSWGGTFGRSCPAPDFAAAEVRRRRERIAVVTWIYTDHPLRTTGGAALLAVAGIAWIAWTSRRKRARAAASQA